MRLFFLIISVVMFNACNHKDHHHGSRTEEKKNHEHHHGDTSKQGKNANEHMHQSSVEELIKRFESPERDEYQKPDKVMEYLGNLSGKKIIDIGAGSGYFTVKLAQKGAKVIAADVEDKFLDHIKKRIEENKITNVEPRKIPFDGPGLKDGEVDMVLIVNTYHHLENRSEYFAKVKKGTHKDGELVIIDFFKSEVPVGPPTAHKIAIDEVIADLKHAGYTSFQVNVDLLPYQYIVRAK